MGRNYSGHCVRCGTFRISLHRDHIKPRVAGGNDAPENIQWLCANCHEDKTREDVTNPSYEIREKMRKAKLGKRLSEEHKLNQSKAHLKRLSDPEKSAKYLHNLSKSLLGHHVSEETKQKIAAGHIAYHNKRRMEYFRLQLCVFLLSHGVVIGN